MKILASWKAMVQHIIAGSKKMPSSSVLGKRWTNAGIGKLLCKGFSGYPIRPAGACCLLTLHTDGQTMSHAAKERKGLCH